MSKSTYEDAVLPELLSLKELARYLGVPPSTVYYWRNQRTGPPGFRIGKQLRYRVSEVDAWLRQREEREATP
jgi:excisionase family DNA binding protein